MKTLILGGIRSGKSRLAERLALESRMPVTYIATATAQDAEMQQRITLHQARRPQQWRLVEEPLQLAQTLTTLAEPNQCLLVDCLTLWLTNLLMTNDDERLAIEIHALVAAIPNLPGKIILVSNETNLGIVPLGEMSRRFCDEAGLLHQNIAQLCDTVVLTVAGLPHLLKGNLP